MLLLGAAFCVQAPAQVVVNEVLALNHGSVLDADGHPSDFVELHNTSRESVSLQGHYLTDDPAQPTRWRFGNVAISGLGYVVVWCSGKDRPSGPAPHTSFKLARQGGQVLLVAPDAVTIMSSLPYGKRDADVSQGRAQLVEPTQLVGPGSQGFWRKSSKAKNTDWTRVEYDRSSWVRGPFGVGWGKGHVAPDRLRTELPRDGRPHIQLAIEFDVDDPFRWHHYVLDMAFLDGFIARLNGHELGRSNIRDAESADQRVPEPAVHTETINVRGFAERIRPGKNVLAVQGFVRHGWVETAFWEPTLTAYALTQAAGPASIVSFVKPTPGGPNRGGYEHVLRRPVLEPAHAWLEGPIDVAVTLPSGAPADAALHYTLDGTEPSPTSPSTRDVIRVERSARLRVRAFSPSAGPSPVANGTYVARDPSELDFSSNLPVIVVNTFGTTVHHDARAFTRIDVFEPGEDGRTTVVGAPSMTAPGAIRTRGSSTLYRLKKQYRLELHDETGDDVAIPLLGLPADSDWVLYGPFNYDRSHIRNPLALELARRVHRGRWSPRTRFCEVFVNQGNGRLRPEHYNGLYVLIEKIKRGKHRVDVEKQGGKKGRLDPSGGYIFKIDRLGPGEKGFSAGGQKLQYVYPKERSITDPQRKWLKDHIDAFGRALNGENFADPKTGYPAFIDVDEWIRFHVFQEFTRNPDGFKLSTYLHKPRGGKIRMGPHWDFDRVFRTHDDPTWVGRAADTHGWSRNGYYGWWGVLFRDPAFRARYREIGRGLLANELSVENVHALIDELAGRITEAAERNHRRWPIVPPGEWENDIRALKKWIADRHAWFAAELLEIPFFEWTSGVPPLRLTISDPGKAGEIWYTTDGSDPMLEDGTLSPRAKLYVAPLDITEPTAVIARVKVGDRFSRITDRRFGGKMPTLVVTEIMYNPPQGRHYEYVEVTNVGDEPADLRGVTLSGAVRFAFSVGPIHMLQPGERILVGFQPHNLSKIRDGTQFTATGPYLGRLSNTKGELVLRDAIGREISRCAYDDGWYPSTDGKGSSLELIDPRGDRSNWTKKRGWKASPSGGTPGR